MEENKFSVSFVVNTGDSESDSDNEYEYHIEESKQNAGTSDGQTDMCLLDLKISALAIEIQQHHKYLEKVRQKYFRNNRLIYRCYNNRVARLIHSMMGKHENLKLEYLNGINELISWL